MSRFHRRVQTRLIPVDADHPADAPLDEAAAVLAAGGLVAFATETVYGLGAVAMDRASVARIFEAKGRPSFNPLIVHADGIALARSCTSRWDDLAQRLAERFWPGPLTLVLPRAREIPDVVTAGRRTVAVRVPATAVAREVIARVGQPLAAPSANRSNRLSPTRAEHVLADLDGRVDLILDSGPTRLGLESTVLDLTTSPPRILRPGPITESMLRASLPAGILVDDDGTHAHESSTLAQSSPGRLPVHYAPRTPTFRFDSTDDLSHLEWSGRVVLLVVGPDEARGIPEDLPRVVLPAPAAAARDLYDALHQLDQRGCDTIFIRMPPDTSEWHAVRDRLTRASAARPLPEKP